MPKAAKAFINTSHRRSMQPYQLSSAASIAPLTMANRDPSLHHAGADRHPSQSWPPEKDLLLMEARQQGMNWQPIATKHFPDKTANACRKRHERLMEKRNSADSWDGVKMESLAKAYLDVREQMWQILADRVGEKWQTVEAKCMEKGVKTLQTAGRTASRRERQNVGLSDFDDEITDSRFGSNRDRSNSHRNDDDDFNDSAIGHDDPGHPFSHGGSSRDEQIQAPYSAGSGSTPPSFGSSDRRVSYSTAASSTGYTPTIANTPIFSSQIHNPQQILPTPYSHQPQMLPSPQQQLPSFSSAFGMPSISSVMGNTSRHHSPAVTTLG